MKKVFIIFLLIYFFNFNSYSSFKKNFFYKRYNIKSIKIIGCNVLDKNILISILKLKTGNSINLSLDINNIIKKVWKNNIVENIKIFISKIDNKNISIIIEIKEGVLLDKYYFFGIKKKHKNNLKKKLNLIKGQLINDYSIIKFKNIIKSYFNKKGFYGASVKIFSFLKGAKNNIKLKIRINKYNKFYINNIIINGNVFINKNILKYKIKNKLNIFHFFDNFFYLKFFKKKYKNSRNRMINFYHTQGFKDIKIISEYFLIKKKRKKDIIDIYININEGLKFFVNKIVWNGNSKFNKDILNNLIQIHKGDIYNINVINKKIENNIKKKYLNNGYLFCKIDIIKKKVNKNLIDLEFKINEGPRFYINNIIIDIYSKEKKTIIHDYIIRKEIKTLPGNKFNQINIIKSHEYIKKLDIFNLLKFNIIPIFNNNNLNIKYKLLIKNKDTVRFIGGWGQGLGFIGTVEFLLNNFSIKNILNINKDFFLPKGGGQKISIKISSNGKNFKDFSFKFIDPWFKKNNSLYFNLENSIRFQDGFLKKTGFEFSFKKKINYVDNNYLTFSRGFSYYHYNYKKYKLFGNNFFSGILHNLIFNIYLEQDNINHNAYLKNGFKFGVYIKVTPPYSFLFSNKKYYLSRFIKKKNIKNFFFNKKVKKFKNIEYYQWILKFSYFNNIIGDFLFNLKGSLGVIGKLPYSSYENQFSRFHLGGGDGFFYNSQYSIIDKIIIPLRGYTSEEITPYDMYNKCKGGTVYNKFIFELRYPININKFSMYILAFIEGGNNWINFFNYNIFDLKKSGGIGFRVLLPVIGNFGIDWSYAFNNNYYYSGIINSSQFNILVGVDI